MSEDQTNVGIKNRIAFSGFPFQKQIEKDILSGNTGYDLHQVEVPIELPKEFLLRNSITPSLDIVLTNCVNNRRFQPSKWTMDVLIECKKAHEKDWYFFSTINKTSESPHTFPMFASIYQPTLFYNDAKMRAIHFNCGSSTSPIPPPICDNALEYSLSNKKKNMDRDVMYLAGGLLAQALFHFLSVEINNIRRDHENREIPNDVVIIIPMIVTSANLHIINSDKLVVDSGTGKLDTTSIDTKEVDWLLFEFPISPIISNHYSNLYDLGDYSTRDINKMGCVVIRGDKLIRFLKLLNIEFSKDIAKVFYDMKSPPLLIL